MFHTGLLKSTHGNRKKCFTKLLDIGLYGLQDCFHTFYLPHAPKEHSLSLKMNRKAIIKNFYNHILHAPFKTKEAHIQIDDGCLFVMGLTAL